MQETRYILHGGFSKGVKSSDGFFKAILSGFAGPVKVLLVMYAKEVDRWEQNIVEVQQEFVKNAEETLLTFEVADLKRIVGQVEGSDIIYIHGGDTELLVSTLDVTMDWTDMFKGKVVAGDSAGGNFLSKIGYSPKKDSFFSGSGVVPVVFIPHFMPGHEYHLPPHADMEVLRLKEYEHVEFIY